ncbi:hypothetical protein ACOMHN_023285 [Nucella lapillus]
MEEWSSSSADTTDSGHGGSEMDVTTVKVSHQDQCLVDAVSSTHSATTGQCPATDHDLQEVASFAIV